MGLPPPPPPPAYLSERLLFSAAQLANIDFVADYVATHLSFYTQQGGFYFNYYDANGKYYYVRIPFLEPTPDIISLPFDTGSEVAELWQVDYEIQGFTTKCEPPSGICNNPVCTDQDMVPAWAIVTCMCVCDSGAVSSANTFCRCTGLDGTNAT